MALMSSGCVVLRLPRGVYGCMMQPRGWSRTSCSQKGRWDGLVTAATLCCAVRGAQVDPVFEGLAGGANSLVKYNPLSNVSSAEVWNFLRVMVSHSAARAATLAAPATPGGPLAACSLLCFGCCMACALGVLISPLAWCAHEQAACVRLPQPCVPTC